MGSEITMAAHVLYHDNRSRARLASISKNTLAVAVLFSGLLVLGPRLHRTTLGQSAITPPLIALTADEYGQWHTDVKANGVLMHAGIIDTGAHGILIPYADALKMNLRQKLVFDSPSQTAGGREMMARIVLREFSIGPITLRNVEAHVGRKVSFTLVGMGFLKSREFHAKNGILSVW
jgi:clan AA aspartic protease (TIGR02281 family)